MKDQHRPIMPLVDSDDAKYGPEPAGPPHSSLKARAAGPAVSWCLLAILLFALAAYVPGMNWGLPAYNSWSQDTIAGPNRTFVVEGWPGDWRGRYPPLHYLINARLYRAIETVWRWTGTLSVDPATGEKILAEPHLPRLGLLILASRVVTFLMAVGTGAALFMAGRRLTSDNTVALMAALMFLGGADFAYFARLGNVDVPSMCWMGWSFYFYVRLAETRRMRDALLLAAMAAAAVCTKDGVAGVYPGMAAVLLVGEAQRLHRHRSPEDEGPRASVPWAVVLALVQPRWLVGMVVFAALTLFVNGAFHNWHRFAARMSYWLDASADTLHAQQRRYPNPAELAWVALRYAGGAVGWPMLAALLAGCAYAVRRNARLAAVALAPAASYYLLVIERGLEFVYSRFLFPVLALAVIPAAWAAARFLRSFRVDNATKGLVAALLVIPTLGYLASVGLEMVNDSRYEAEAWLRERLPAGKRVGVVAKPQYLPRVVEAGYDVREVPLTPEDLRRSGCDAFVVASYDFESFGGPAKEAFDSLMGGEFGYRVEARFGGWRFLSPQGSWLSVAGWGAEPPGKISPRIIILVRAGAGEGGGGF